MDPTGLQAELPKCEVRAATLDDVAAITRLAVRVTTAATGRADATETEIRDDLVGPRFDISKDTIVAVQPDGELLVYAQAYAEHDEVAYLDVYLDPSLPDDKFATISDVVIKSGIDRIIEVGRERGVTPERISAGLYQEETRARLAYERAGLEVDRLYWRMEIALSPDADYSYRLDGRTEIRRVDPSDDSVMRTAVKLNNEAFSEHHGFVVETYEDVRERWVTAESFDRSGWWIAYLNDEPVGLCLCDNSRAEAGAGYVRSLGVLKQARGRGIARALLLTSFDYYRALGRQTVQLGVDSENSTGATRLYESVGMTPILSITSLRKTLTPLG